MGFILANDPNISTEWTFTNAIGKMIASHLSLSFFHIYVHVFWLYFNILLIYIVLSFVISFSVLLCPYGNTEFPAAVIEIATSFWIPTCDGSTVCLPNLFVAVQHTKSTCLKCHDDAAVYHRRRVYFL